MDIKGVVIENNHYMTETLVTYKSSNNKYQRIEKKEFLFDNNKIKKWFQFLEGNGKKKK